MRCSYCAIPNIRGRHRSVPMEELLDEARELAGRGVKELVLIAQDTTYYGIDLFTPFRLFVWKLAPSALFQESGDDVGIVRVLDGLDSG